jgi:hypothetical protein
MSNTFAGAHPRTHKVIVVGLKSCQIYALTLILQPFPIKVQAVAPGKLLRLRRVDCLVVLTRFVGHKHTLHARQITSKSRLVEHGAARAVANTIIEYFGFKAC